MRKLPIINWFDKDTIKHLRFPFSFFLLPVFLFALSQSDHIIWFNTILSFTILHLLIFPSGNGYNSYQDRDESSIGGLKYPPKVNRNLFYVTFLFDILAIIFALIISLLFGLMVLLYITMSRMYSYRGIRLKKFPVIGFLTVFLFQGGFVYLMSAVAITSRPVNDILNSHTIVCMIVSSLFIGSMYPITQIYQHEADMKDGVYSLSYMLGYRGTFLFSGGLFLIGTILMSVYFAITLQYLALFLFPVIIFPVILFLNQWFIKVSRNNIYANFENTMKANLLSSACMNTFFLIVLISNRIV